MDMQTNNGQSDGIGTTELVVGVAAFAVTFLLLSDDSGGGGGGVVPTIKRVVPKVPAVKEVTNPSSNSGGVNVSESVDSITNLVDTGAGAVDTASEVAQGQASNLGVDLPDVTDPAVVDAVSKSAIDASPAASAANEVINIVSGDGSGGSTGGGGSSGGGSTSGSNNGGSSDFQESVNSTFSDFV